MFRYLNTILGIFVNGFSPTYEYIMYDSIFNSDIVIYCFDDSCRGVSFSNGAGLYAIERDMSCMRMYHKILLHAVKEGGIGHE